ATLRSPKNEKRFAARATFFLRWEGAPITSRLLTFMTNWRRTRTSRATGATRRYSKRLSVWKRKTTGPARLRRFTKSWRPTRAHMDAVNSYGTTRPDLMPRGFWRQIRNGSLRLRVTDAWLRPAAAEAKHPRPA